MPQVSKIDEALMKLAGYGDNSIHDAFKAARDLDNFNKYKQTLLSVVLEALPVREGGAALGKNYRTGYAKGNNDTLDEMEANIRKVFGVEG
jgi:hypothetical protein